MDSRKGLGYVEEMIQVYQGANIPYYDKEMEMMEFIQKELRDFIAQEKL